MTLPFDRNSNADFTDMVDVFFDDAFDERLSVRIWILKVEEMLLENGIKRI